MLPKAIFESLVDSAVLCGAKASNSLLCIMLLHQRQQVPIATSEVQGSYEIIELRPNI